MNGKLLFLDIDGTLTEPGYNVPPASALEAIRKAQKNGHKVYLCSGRNKAMHVTSCRSDFIILSFRCCVQVGIFIKKYIGCPIMGSRFFAQFSFSFIFLILFLIERYTISQIRANTATKIAVKIRITSHLNGIQPMTR